MKKRFLRKAMTMFLAVALVFTGLPMNFVVATDTSGTASTANDVSTAPAATTEPSAPAPAPAATTEPSAPAPAPAATTEPSAPTPAPALDLQSAQFRMAIAPLVAPAVVYKSGVYVQQYDVSALPSYVNLSGTDLENVKTKWINECFNKKIATNGLVLERNLSNVFFARTADEPSNRRAVKIYGYIKPKADIKTLSVRSDDGVKVYLDKTGSGNAELVASDFTTRLFSDAAKDAAVDLKADKYYKFQIEFFDWGGLGGLKLFNGDNELKNEEFYYVENMEQPVPDPVVEDSNFILTTSSEGNLVKYFPNRTTNKTELVKQFTPALREIAVSGNTVYAVKSGDKNLYKESLSKTASGYVVTESVVYSGNLIKGVEALTIGSDGKLYFVNDKVVYQLEMGTQKITCIQNLTEDSGGDLAFLNGKLYYIENGGIFSKSTLHIIDPVNKTYTTKSINLDNTAGLAVFDGKLFIANNQSVYSYDVNNFTLGTGVKIASGFFENLDGAASSFDSGQIESQYYLEFIKDRVLNPTSIDIDTSDVTVEYKAVVKNIGDETIDSNVNYSYSPTQGSVYFRESRPSQLRVLSNAVGGTIAVKAETNLNGTPLTASLPVTLNDRYTVAVEKPGTPAMEVIDLEVPANNPSHPNYKVGGVNNYNAVVKNQNGNTISKANYSLVYPSNYVQSSVTINSDTGVITVNQDAREGKNFVVRARIGEKVATTSFNVKKVNNWELVFVAPITTVKIPSGDTPVTQLYNLVWVSQHADQSNLPTTRGSFNMISSSTDNRISVKDKTLSVKKGVLDGTQITLNAQDSLLTSSGTKSSTAKLVVTLNEQPTMASIAINGNQTTTVVAPGYSDAGTWAQKESTLFVGPYTISAQSDYGKPYTLTADDQSKVVYTLKASTDSNSKAFVNTFIHLDGGNRIAVESGATEATFYIKASYTVNGTELTAFSKVVVTRDNSIKYIEVVPSTTAPVVVPGTVPTPEPNVNVTFSTRQYTKYSSTPVTTGLKTVDYQLPSGVVGVLKANTGWDVTPIAKGNAFSPANTFEFGMGLANAEGVSVKPGVITLSKVPRPVTLTVTPPTAPITVPAKGEPEAASSLLMAEVKSQYDEVVALPPVTYSLEVNPNFAEVPNSIYMSQSGNRQARLQVTSDAKAPLNGASDRTVNVVTVLPSSNLRAVTPATLHWDRTVKTIVLSEVVKAPNAPGQPIVLPAQGEPNVTRQYKADMFDKYGAAVAGTPRFQTLGSFSGFEINESTGLVTVTSAAPIGTFGIIAVLGNVRSNPIGVTVLPDLTPKSVNFVKANGENEEDQVNLVIPGYNVPIGLLQLRALAKDKYNHVLLKSPIKYELGEVSKENQGRIKVDSNTGVLQLDGFGLVKPEVVTVKATSLVNSNLSDQIRVNLQYGQGIAYGIQFNDYTPDQKTIVIPEKGENSATYLAFVTDNYGRKMAPQPPVKYRLNVPVTGVTVNADTGLVTVTDKTALDMADKTIKIIASRVGEPPAKSKVDYSEFAFSDGPSFGDLPSTLKKPMPLPAPLPKFEDTLEVTLKVEPTTDTPTFDPIKEGTAEFTVKSVPKALVSIWKNDVLLGDSFPTSDTGTVLLKGQSFVAGDRIKVVAKQENHRTSLAATGIVNFRDLEVDKDDVKNVYVEKTGSKMVLDNRIEYSTDGGKTWTKYSVEKPPVFPGYVVTSVRYAEIVEVLKAGTAQEIIFTKNKQEKPAVTADDVNNVIAGLAPAMEYKISDGAWTKVTGPVTFPGSYPVYVRYAETELLAASDPTEVGFTIPAATGNNERGGGERTFANVIIADELTPLGAVKFNNAYMVGYPNKTFKPTAIMTRAEAAAVFANVLGLNTKITNGVTYSDVSKTNWHYGAIQASVKVGLLTTKDGKFNPNAPVTRADMAAAFAKFWELNNIKVSDAATKTTDIAGHWAEKQINQTINAKLMAAFDDNTFKPDSAVTREQTAVMFNKLIARAKIAKTKPSFKDVSLDYWAAGDIEAAVMKMNLLGK